MISASASATFQTEIQPSLECPVCTTPYNRTQHAPLILLCGHTLCKSCVNKLYHPSKSIVCPLDRKVDNRKFVHIPQSLLVIEMIDTITHMKEQIDFLKLTPEEKRVRKAERLQEAAQECRTLIKDLDTHIESVRTLAAGVQGKIRDTFSHLQRSLADRQLVLEHEASVLHDEEAEKYRRVVSSLEEQLEEEANGVFRGGEMPEISQPDFKFTYVKNDKSAVEALREFGKLDLLLNKVPYECEHFMNISYWMLPPCCGKHYCCNKCHDKRETHTWQYADKMVCMYCTREQPYRKLPNNCEFCGEEHKGVISKL